MNWRIGVLLSFLFTLQLKKSEAINQTYSNIVKGLEIGNCEPGYYGFPYCTLCACDPVGSVNQTCDSNGWCTCAPRFNGPKCNHCSAGYYNFPKCEACNCDPAGSYGVTCQNGVCQCRDNFEGIKCDKCKKNFYNFPICESCSCNPAGVVPNFTGSLNGLDACDGESGQCAYKGPETDDIREKCAYGFYAFAVGNNFSCVPCECDLGGSRSGPCDPRTGSCKCRFGIEGRRCDRPQKAHYYHTTYQYLYELEDAHRVHYDYNETVFPGFSWKGYAKFSDLQKKVIIDFLIVRSSFYQVILNYHNPGTEPIVGNLTLSNENEPPQHIKITFPPTSAPKKYLLSMDKTSPLYLFAAQRPWKASLSADEPLLVDYIVFLPQAYFEASILRENVTAACTISTANYQLCRHYDYTKFPTSAIKYPDRESTTLPAEGADTRDSFLIDATLLSDTEREHVFDMAVDKTQKYVLILSYVYRVTNPPPIGQVAKLTVEVKTINGTVNNPFQVPMCQYTFPCRHIVLNEKAAPFEFHLESGSIPVSVKLNNEIGEATFSILGLVFLPKSDWNIDHVKPSLVCIMRNFTCLNMSYDLNSESTKIPFGQRGKVSPVSTNAIEGSDIQDRTVELVGTAPRTENYQLIVHYYQPDHPSFDIELTFQRTPTSPPEQATLNIAHCPSKNGCRSVIKFKKPLGVLEENKEFTLATIPPKDRGVQFDYLLLTAEKSFTPNQLRLPIVDKSTEFLKHCVQDAFHIDDSSSEFCKQALFTLTTGLNNGGAFCSCNSTGSKGFTCNPLGGQCDCKPNVIGRECKACRSDYYGFPDCKPCNCTKTAAYCEPVTGECVCPKNVVGSDCAKCAPLTYGYDPKMGCEACNCHPTGVKDGNLQCDLQFGTCDCKEKYDGRTCDSCKAGYFDFPVCRVCDCHFDGTTVDICDRKSGTCYCKENVLRPNCDVCRRGTYNLEKNNPKGCTKCFCFGTTENCRSSEFKSVPIRATNYTNWSTVNIDFTESGERISFLEIESGPNESEYKVKPRLFSRGDTADVLPKADTLSNIYFKVPNEFLGNRLTSYGGFINYTIFESIETSSSNAEDTVITPDIILIGRNYSIALTRDEQPEAPGINLKMEIELLESKFVHLTDSTLVSRPQFMTLLLDLQSIYIRAAYFKSMDSVTLTDFTIDSALDLPNINGSLASRVEQCICPPNYKGSSCEECASGYYRVANGPYLGSCAPCQCNGHSNECDPLTGKCFNCKHETVGDHCELCKSGFYGNATVGTPHDCLMCPCPMPNNFAESCEVRQNARLQTEIVCNCKPGYSGQNCELCSAGHFGYPLLPGNYCQPCQCNGNTDPKDPGSCDMFSGECIKCLNNTAGQSCEYCADDYYGDAINLKNCKPCQCDPDGTAVCDRYSGQCECHPNVIGDSCDSCKPNHYGFNKGKGCIDCNCANASKGYDCDMETGQCYCQPGATGRTCNECEAGYWKYSTAGCESCGCVEKYSRGAVCNQQTGHCECLPGVVGEKCDKCPWRWVFVDREGCLECGECQHALLNDTDTLEREIVPILNDFSNSSSGVHAKRKFATLNNRVAELYKVREDFDQASKAIDLSPVENSLDKLTNESDLLSPWQERLTRLANSVIIKVDETKENATNVRRMIKKVKAEMDKLIKQLNDTDNNLVYEVINDPNIESMTSQAENYFNFIDRIKFENFVVMIANETDETISSLDRATDFISPYIDEKQNLNESRSQMEKIESVLNDANKKIISSITVALDVQRGLNHSREAIKEIIIPRSSSMKNMESGIIDNLKECQIKIDLSEPIIKSTDESFTDLLEISGRLNGLKDSLKERMFNPEELQDSELKELTARATEHSYNLDRSAKDLDSLFLEAIRKADINRTMKAATAYEVIEKAIESAELSLTNSINLLAEKPWEGLRDKISASRTASTGNRTEAGTQHAEILTFGTRELAPYNDTIKELKSRIDQQGEKMKRIDEDLKALESTSSIENAENITSESEKVVKIALDALLRAEKYSLEAKSIDNITKQLYSEERIAFMDLHESSTMTGIYYKSSITDKITASKSRIDNMLTRINDSKSSLTSLKSMISKARDLSNRIDIAMKIQPGSFSQLRKPEDLESSGSYNKLSLYFNTTESEGLLAIIGNLRSTNNGGSRNKRDFETTDDYMAILLSGGKVRVVLDLGSGPQSLETETRVNDGTWTYLIVERIGKTLKITVNKDNKEIVTHGHIDGFSSILDLNSKRSTIFLGSIPNDYVVPDTINVNSFSGSLAHLTLGDTPLGLFNYQRAKYLTGDFIPNRTVIEELHFSGRGWATTTVDTSKLVSSSPISVDVRTYAKSGLILLLTGPTDYLAIQLNDGRPRVIIDQGSGYVSLEYPDKINDGNKHTIVFDRAYRDVTLTIRGREPMRSQTSGSQTTLELDPVLYIGGYSTKHSLPEVSQIPFEGCLSDLSIDAKAVSLSNTTMTPGVMTGCPDSGVREAVFEPDQPGFIEMPLSIEIFESVQISFKFRTNLSDGLLFFATNPDQPSNSFMAIYILDGTLTLTTHPGTTIKSSGFRYDDNEWHYVMATRNSYQLRLDIDDKTEVDLDLSAPVDLNIPAGSFYMGGAPNTFATVLKDFNISDKFIGCIGDAVVHDKFQDLRKATKVQGATLVTCKIVSDGKSRKVNRTQVTSTPPPEPTTPAPRRQSPCALPLDPNYPEISIATHGRRFFSSEDSRAEIKLASETIGSMQTKASVTLEFRTYPQYKDESAQGIMLILTDAQYVDLFAVYMKNGQLYLTWNLGGGLMTIGASKLNNQYDDGAWHSATFSLSSREGTISYPNGDKLTGIAPGNSQSLNIVSPAYIGGLPKSGAERIKSLLFNITHSFPGCIRNVIIGGMAVSLEDTTGLTSGNKFYNAPPCSDSIEEGTFFNGQNSYLSCYDRFRIGSNIEFDFMIKPRNNSGLLAASFGNPDDKGRITDYLIVKLVDGRVIASINNGAGPKDSIMTLLSNISVCDGSWHSIQVLKLQNAHFVSVNGASASGLIFGPGGINVADTVTPMYLGDVPNGYRTKFPDLPPPYIGCIKNVKYNRPAVSEGKQIINVDLVFDCKNSGNAVNLCPTV